jgi:hypothetical protein
MRLLTGHRDRSANVILTVVAQVAAGQRQPPLLGVEETQEEVGDGRLARTARTEERDPLAGLEPEADIIDGRTGLTRVPRAHVLELHGERRRGAGAGCADRAPQRSHR